MTKKELRERWRYHLGGLVLDAATAGRRGSEGALWLSQAMKQIDGLLDLIHESLRPVPDVSTDTPVGLTLPQSNGKRAT